MKRELNLTKFLIITSTEDKASMNIRKVLLEDTLLNFEELEHNWQNHPLLELKRVIAKADWGPFFAGNAFYLGLTDSPLIQLNGLKLQDTKIDPDLIIFASRHRSETARPAFLTHPTGNWGSEAEYGGNPHELSKTSALLLKAAFNTLSTQRHIKSMWGFAVDIEVTHHGPTTIEKPLIFMELGSSENEWGIEHAGKVVAHSTFHTCLTYSKMLEEEGSHPKIGLGFGGTHYAPQFRKLIDERNVALSFICPKYYIQDLDKKMIQQMIDNTREKVDFFIVDWKGTNSEDKKHLIPLLEEFNIPIKKTKEL